MSSSNPKPIGESRSTRTEIEDPHGEKHTGITIFDKSEPRSVYNLVTTEVQNAIDRVHPDIWKMSFKVLERKAYPDATLSQLRVAFWHEYNLTQDQWKKGVSLTRVMHGICTKPTFYSFLRDQYKLAYLLYPTTEYISAMMEMHDLATREMRKILTIPNAGKKGANMPVIREKIKIFALLENRLRGTVPIKIQRDERHLHAHVHSTQPILHDHQKAPQSLAEIEKEINRIDRTVKEAMKVPQGSESAPLEIGQTKAKAPHGNTGDSNE